MKPLLAFLVFVVGVVVATVACLFFNHLNEGARQVQLLSDVHYPLRQCLDDVVRTQERGDIVLAQEKVRLLQQRWSEYLEGRGRAPELFANEITQLTSASSRPAH